VRKCLHSYTQYVKIVGMSKHSKTGLTGSRKKARHQARNVEVVNVLDGLADCHRRLAALAGLLEACGEPMEARQVSNAGALVNEQVRRLGELIDTLDHMAPQL
jgi:hypothetical protein